jgi:hypothetical protein
MRLRRLALAGAAAGTIVVAGPALAALADGPAGQSNDACVHLNLLFITLNINLNLGPGVCPGQPVPAPPVLSLPRLAPPPGQVRPAAGSASAHVASRSSTRSALVASRSARAGDGHARRSPATVSRAAAGAGALPDAGAGTLPDAGAGALPGAASTAGGPPAAVNPGPVSGGQRSPANGSPAQHPPAQRPSAHGSASRGPASRGPASRGPAPAASPQPGTAQQPGLALQPGPVSTAATGYSPTVPFDRALSIPLQTPRMTLHQTILITTVGLIASVFGGFSIGSGGEHTTRSDLAIPMHPFALYSRIVDNGKSAPSG